MTETIAMRVVRTVHQVRPRWLSAKDVMDGCPDDNSAVVYATLSAHAKEAVGPLQKRRSDAGVYEYTTAEDFDLDAWLNVKGKRAPVVREPKAALEEPEAQIVKALLAAKRRLTADEIERICDCFSRESLNLRLAAMIKPPDGVLERDRVEIGKPWVYGVRRDVDIEAWLREQGSTTEVVGLTEYNAQSTRDPKPAIPPAPTSTSKDAEPVSVAATKAAAPQVPETVRTGPDSTDSPRKDRLATPAAPAEPKRREQLDLMTELTIVAAANLAAAVRACDQERTSRELRTFERADRLREEMKAGRA